MSLTLSIQGKLLCNDDDANFFLGGIRSQEEEEHHWSSWLCVIETLYVMSMEVEIQALVR